MPHKDPEARTAWRKAWEERTKAERKAKKAAYYLANKERDRPKKRQYFRDTYQDRKEGLRAYTLSHYSKNPAYYLLRGAKARAKKSGLEFSLKPSDLIIPEFCPYLGIAVIVGLGKGKLSPNSASLDRVNPRKGYVPGNVEVISYRANMLKNDATVEELTKIIARLKEITN